MNNNENKQNKISISQIINSFYTTEKAEQPITEQETISTEKPEEIIENVEEIPLSKTSLWNNIIETIDVNHSGDYLEIHEAYYPNNFDSKFLPFGTESHILKKQLEYEKERKLELKKESLISIKVSKRKKPDRVKSELELIREARGIEYWEVAEKLGRDKNHYRAIEQANGYSNKSNNDEFLKLFYMALKDVERERRFKSKQCFASMKANKKGFLEEQLIYLPLTKERYAEALYLMKEKNLNIIQTSIKLEIDEELLAKKIASDVTNSYILEESKKRDNKYKAKDTVDNED